MAETSKPSSFTGHDGKTYLSRAQQTSPNTNTAWWTGPGTEWTDGTDIGFAVSAVIVAVLYPLMLKLFPEPRELFPDDGEASFDRAYATVEPQAKTAEAPPHTLEPA